MRGAPGRSARAPGGDERMRRDVEFDAEGVTLRGWLYAPEGGGPLPRVVMAHGFSAVKEMYLDDFAAAFAEAGLAALVFDNRNFGASDGEPRQEIDPGRRYATTGTRSRSRHPDGDRRRPHWGLGVELLGRPRDRAGRDRPARQVRRGAGPARRGQENARAAGARRLHRGCPRRLRPRPRSPLRRGAAGDGPVVDPDPRGERATHAGLRAWFSETGMTRAPSWENEVTLRSVELFWRVRAQTYVPGQPHAAARGRRRDHLVGASPSRPSSPRANRRGSCAARRAFRRLRRGLRGGERSSKGLVRPASRRVAQGARCSGSGAGSLGPRRGLWSRAGTQRPSRGQTVDTRAVLDHHLTAFSAGDVDEVLEDYTDASVLIMPDATIAGREALHAAFTDFVSGLFKPGTYDFIMDVMKVEGDTRVHRVARELRIGRGSAGHRHLRGARRQNRDTDLRCEDRPDVTLIGTGP